MLLERINSPEDLRKLSSQDLPKLALEIRGRMVEAVAKTGGHLASSLGTVELTLALHYCFNTPRDKIVWDVGHQAYAHKIITGRNIEFDTLRQYQGLSGFPSVEESIYDVFTTGHSSTAVSLALGLACARDTLPLDKQFKVIAVIGDGSLSGGLCFEGLNNAGHFKKDLLVVLNTNELSIAPNAGALSTYLNKIISLPLYNRFKTSLENFAQERLPKGSRLIKMANKFEEGLKGLFVPGMFFEELGFRYFGPLDGHDLELLIRTLKNILPLKGPRLLHIVTKKGKGYPPAEREPVRFHGVSAFDIKTGETPAKPAGQAPSYTDVFSKKLISLASKDKKIVAITAAMPEGTGLDKFRDMFGERFFDVGIAEAHAVAFAAGLAKEGLKPVVAVYSTFLQRAYDQIMEEIALQKLPVVFAIDRAGIVGEDGLTHQGIFDLAFLLTIPNLVIMSPKDGQELETMLEFSLKLGQPVAIRYPRDSVPATSHQPPATSIELGKGEILRQGKDILLIAIGTMVEPALEAARNLAAQGIEATVINSRFLRPLDSKLIQEAAAEKKFIFTLEEGIIDSGLGSAVSEIVMRPVTRIGLPCAFIPHGNRKLLLDKYELSAEQIAKRINSLCPR